MSIGKNIKQLRELRNYTQSYMAEALNISIGGYSKIERDETEITLNRLGQIAKVLEIDIETILRFDSKNIFNQTHNKTATQNGVVHNQQIINESKYDDVLKKVDELFELLKNK